MMLLAGAACLASPAYATTKGLNQVVTPDIQPEGQLSVSIQQVDPNIANRYQTQFELGVTKQFEVAVFQGFSPSQQVFNAEYGLIQSKDVLLSTGIANYASNGCAPQPYLEAGYITGNAYLMAGLIHVYGCQNAGIDQNSTQGILGAAYHVNPKLLAQLDYQSGSNNFSTAGFTYNITPQLQVNPAVYLSNTAPHTGYGYVVLTWSLTAWK
jgi:hypothetical protein